MRNDSFLSQSKILERGWTKKMVDTLLAEPDLFKRNPAYKSAPPMRLYLLSRVEQAEKQPEFVALKSSADKRRKALQPSIDQRRWDTLRRVRNLPIWIKKVSLEHCQREALQFYYAYHGRDDRIDVNVVKRESPEFLDRITVNHIRHCRTRYDDMLVQQAGNIGVREAQEIVRAKVYKAIMDTFPELADECLRQLDHRECDLSLAA